MGKVSRAWIASALACGLACAWTARADLYQAAAAVEKNDLPRAFELYREVAELGHAGAQENLAAMYVNGEGVARDNILGYAWAKLALENGGGGETAKAIVAQLESRLSESGRAKAAEVRAKFGHEVLAQRILPLDLAVPAEPRSVECRMKTAGNPMKFYPPGAQREGISGSVMVEAPVNADGSSRAPRAVYGVPEGVFEEAGRGVALASRYWSKPDTSVKECSVRFAVHFNSGEDSYSSPGPKTRKAVANLKVKAEAGDPLSQMTYGAILGLWRVFNTQQENDARWFLKAAQAGVPAAQFMVGMNLMGGHGFKQDKVKGVFWLEQSAKGGSGAGQAALASYYLAADNDAATRDKGFDWMRRSAESQHREGKFLFAALLASWRDPMRRDPAWSLALLQEIESSFDGDPLGPEIRARVLAERGDFRNAQKFEARAIEMARQLEWDTTRAEARLRAYEAATIPDGELIEF